MTIDNDIIRNLLAELIDLPLEERLQRLSDLEKSDHELHNEIQSLLPYTEGDCDDTGEDPFIGEVIEHFTIKHRIGTGGMGRVYLAHQENPPRDVAFKVLRRGLLSRSASKRFEIECRLLGRLHHGGIAQVYEAGTHIMAGDRVPWIAMEFVKDAETITTYAKDSTLSTDEKLALFMQVCKAVAEAHLHGVIHRDLKPDNILVDPQGNPKVIDFGIAKATDPMGLPTALRTQDKNLVGTMQYMSPEQALGEDVDITSDVYALGVILYEVLSGERPYDVHSTDIPVAISTITQSDPKQLRSINRMLRGDLETIVEHAMAHDPKNRYRSAVELCDDIQRVLDGEPIAARKEPLIVKFLRRRRRTAATIMIALPVLAVSTAVSFYFALQTHYELEQKYKLVEFAKDALGTRNEIIMMNPEYWKTHYDLTLTHAQHMAEGDSQLLASMYSMLSAVADTADIDTSLRIKTAELLGTDSEQGTLLIIEQCAYRGIQSIELRIKSINEMIRSIKNPSSTFQATSRIALARLELHSSDPSVRKKGRVHTDEALSIIHDELQDDFQLKYKAIKRLAWSFIFQETETLCCKEILKLVNNDFLEQCTQVFGAHHPNTLASLNLVGLAHEKLGDYDAAIEVLEPAAATARESYGIGHNLTWRYLNNLAVALTYKSKEEDLDPDESETLQLSATLLWIECIRQAIMHEDEGGIRWYGDTFRSMLPEVAPSKEELDKWRKIVQYGTFSDFSDN